jgi:hypothetical protein
LIAFHPFFHFHGGGLKIRGCQIAGQPFEVVHQAVSLLKIPGSQSITDFTCNPGILAAKIKQQFFV